MKHDEKKTTGNGGNGGGNNVSTLRNNSNPSKTVTVPTVTDVKADAIKEEAKQHLKQVNAIERILNDLEVMNSRKENREQLLETLKKLKSFNPTVTESKSELIIKDKHSEFRTTATEPMKMIIGHYIVVVEGKLRDVESDIQSIAVKLAAS